MARNNKLLGNEDTNESYNHFPCLLNGLHVVMLAGQGKSV